MPLLITNNIASDTIVGVWRMDETEEQLLDLHPSIACYLDELNSRYGAPKRRLEWLTVRALMAAMFPTDTPLITYASDGRPLISSNGCISISHTKGYVALMVAESGRVGVDIERRGRSIAHLRHHILRQNENADGEDDLLTRWCAKETIYKMFPDDHLSTNQIHTSIAFCNGVWRGKAVNMKRNIEVELQRMTHEYFILVCAHLPV